MTVRRTFLIAVLLATAACSNDSSVGDEKLKTFKEHGGQGRLGEQTASVRPATPRPNPASTAARPRTAAPSSAPRKSAPARASASPQVSLTVVINSDTAGRSQFDPSAARIYVRTCIAWRNADHVPRSVVADAGTFSSGNLAPGATWTFCPKSTGKFNYHDGTRPYAVASLEVLPR
jgi:plastocyanin